MGVQQNPPSTLRSRPPFFFEDLGPTNDLDPGNGEPDPRDPSSPLRIVYPCFPKGFSPVDDIDVERTIEVDGRGYEEPPFPLGVLTLSLGPPFSRRGPTNKDRPEDYLRGTVTTTHTEYNNPESNLGLLLTRKTTV